MKKPRRRRSLQISRPQAAASAFLISFTEPLLLNNSKCCYSRWVTDFGLLTLAAAAPIILWPFSFALCWGGGIGRRARLRGVWFTPCGFKSHPQHQQPPAHRGGFFRVQIFGALDSGEAGGAHPSSAAAWKPAPHLTPLPLSAILLFAHCPTRGLSLFARFP